MIQFDEALHEYRINGRRIPSVSEIVRHTAGNQYSEVPAFVLKRASEFGTDVHLMIELFNATGIIREQDDPRKLHCLNEWIRLAEEIEIVASEQMVHFNERYCGTFDAIGLYKGQLVLIDYKTTSKIHEEHLTLQLNLYRMAYEKITGKKIKGMLGIWLPKKGEGKIYECKRIPNTKLVKMLDEYEQAHQD